MLTIITKLSSLALYKMFAIISRSFLNSFEVRKQQLNLLGSCTIRPIPTLWPITSHERKQFVSRHRFYDFTKAVITTILCKIRCLCREDNKIRCDQPYICDFVLLLRTH